MSGQSTLSNWNSPQTRDQDSADAGKHSEVHRSAWRERLVQAERGLTTGFRTNSALFFHFFAVSTLASAGIVVELSIFSWGIVLLCVSVILAMELVYSSLNKLMVHPEEPLPAAWEEWINMITSACMILLSGAYGTILLLLSSRMLELNWF